MEPDLSFKKGDTVKNIRANRKGFVINPGKYPDSSRRIKITGVFFGWESKKIWCQPECY